ncbi:MAG TPA: PmoA family protein [Puia sp.]|nr:PmoA family protein [Puia sp.]
MISFMSRNGLRAVLALLAFPAPLFSAAQRLPVQIVADSINRSVIVTAGGIPFTTFWYPDTLEKPVLYPIYAPDGEVITRGFPIKPRPGEPADHPHHVGLWFNYENVNGLDFWNNSYAIPPARKGQYGWIRTDSVSIRSGGPDDASISYAARWTDQQDHTLLTERTHFRFSATAHERIIDRVTRLTAQTDVQFPDAKDGMLGLRVTRELQIPSNAPGEFIDDKGNITSVPAGNAPDINGNYLTSAGRTGDSAWGTRGNWCMMYGKKGADTISIVIIDHPSNPGYPTYWHARGYGLLAANPFGWREFHNDPDKDGSWTIQQDKQLKFRYRVLIHPGDYQRAKVAQAYQEYAAHER